MTPALALAAAIPAVITPANSENLIALLHDEVRWGGDEDTEQTCHNKSDVGHFLATVFESQERAAVIATTVVDDRVLLELQLSGGDDPGPLFLVLTVSGAKIVDIRPADDRADGLRKLHPHPREPQRTQVEVLSVPECPNLARSLALVEHSALELSMPITVTMLTVSDADQAERHKFLGSPTVRIGGIDVEPSAARRTDYGVSCRVYSASTGLTGIPPAQWVHQSLLANRPDSPPATDGRLVDPDQGA